MHLSYFALRHFSGALDKFLKEFTFINAFSFSKEELIFSFLSPENKEVFLGVYPTNKSCYFKISENFNRPKKNYLYQFEEANGGIVSQIIQTPFDRSFNIKLKNGYTFLFKLHGQFSNIILLNPSGVALSLFRKEFQNDNFLTLTGLQKDLDLSLLLTFDGPNYAGLKTAFPIFDTYSINFLKENSFLSLDARQRNALIETYFTGNTITYHLCKDIDGFHLEIFPSESTQVISNPLLAYTELANKVLPALMESKLRQQLALQLQSRALKLSKQLKSVEKQLEIALTYKEIEQLGHVIMANIFQLVPKTTEATLFDFYTNKEIVVRLDKELTAPENAEKYYRKAKAYKQEVPALEKNLKQLQLHYSNILALQAKLVETEGLKALKSFATEHLLQKESVNTPIFPFRKCFVEDYEVWIGKNATNNDVLTFNYAHKNDLWMHARDVAGSHVIIRNQTGKPIPLQVIEKAAGIAAHFSKSKNQQLAVVQYTLKKYVVKSKGRNPGEVNLLNEETILVKPLPLN